jgi:NADH-quinone oxidoreductase subunit N
MIPVWLLEIAVVVWGLVLLCFEAFAPQTDRRHIALAGIGGLIVVFLATFFLAPQNNPLVEGPYWPFYIADPLAIFFKRFALVTTILVLVMALITRRRPRRCSG